MSAGYLRIWVRGGAVAAMLGVGLMPALACAAAPLEAALEAGNKVEAEALLKQGVDVNLPGDDGTTALHWAVQQDDAALVKALLKAGADAKARNDYGATPMSLAAVVGDPEIVKLLLKAGADPNTINEDAQTPLMVIARTDNLPVAKLLIGGGAKVDAAETSRGQTALMWAAAEQKPEMMKLLIKAGAQVDLRSKILDQVRQVSAEPRAQYRPRGGYSALAFAARAGCISCAKVLLDAGADVNLADPDGVTPLSLAIENFHFDVARYLLQAKADPNRWDWWGRTPLYSAVDLNTIPHGGRPDRPSPDKTTSLELIGLLLDDGANPNSQLKLRPPHRNIGADRGCDLAIRMGSTPLMRAAKAFDADAIKLLLAHGALVNLPTVWGITPTMSAAGLGSKDCDTRGRYDTKDVQERSIAALKLLIAAGGKINDVMGGDNRAVLDSGWRSRFEVPDEALQINIGQTPLHGAAFWGWNDVVKFLVAQGADLNAKDANGMTPVDAAMGRAGGNGRGTRIDVHEDTAKLLQQLMEQQTASATKKAGGES